MTKSLLVVEVLLIEVLLVEMLVVGWTYQENQLSPKVVQNVGI